jgi:hypothetical protein
MVNLVVMQLKSLAENWFQAHGSHHSRIVKNKRDLNK